MMNCNYLFDHNFPSSTIITHLTKMVDMVNIIPDKHQHWLTALVNNADIDISIMCKKTYIQNIIL